MTDARLNIADIEFAGDAETREARHELLASLLGAYADGELPAETHSQIDAHLAGCTRCRRELGLHRAVRDRLGNEPVPAASTALRERIAAGMRAAPAPIVAPALGNVAPSDTRAGMFTSARARVVALAVGAVALSGIAVAQFAARERSAPSVVVASASRASLFTSVLADYRRVTAGDLPGRARDLVAVRAAVPFAVTPLANPELRLLGAWTTSLEGEPSAVLAYRWNERVVLQYFVPEGLLFQSPTVRASLARKQDISVNDGAQGMLLWAEPEYGSVLVGDLLPTEFAALRHGTERR